jgi:hypothetical protein
VVRNVLFIVISSFDTKSRSGFSCSILQDAPPATSAATPAIFMSALQRP